MDSRTVRLISRFTNAANLSRLISFTGHPFIAPYYHVVEDRPLIHIKHLYPYRSVTEFEKDLDDMLSLFEPIGLTEFQKQGGRLSGKRSMLLSFDDGLAECHSIIAPILKRKGVPALFFLNNQFIDNQGLLHRFKASLLLEEILQNKSALALASAYLHVGEEMVEQLLGKVSFSQQILLEGLAGELGVDFKDYMNRNQVYMSSLQVRELLEWGFEIGGHSFEHPQMHHMETEEVVKQVMASVTDLRQRFEVPVSSFAFPFSSIGIPGEAIEILLGNQITLFGTSGLRKTNHDQFVQRIDMEKFMLPALDVLKIRYLHFLARRLAGKGTMGP